MIFNQKYVRVFNNLILVRNLNNLSWRNENFNRTTKKCNNKGYYLKILGYFQTVAQRYLPEMTIRYLGKRDYLNVWNNDRCKAKKSQAVKRLLDQEQKNTPTNQNYWIRIIQNLLHITQRQPPHEQQQEMRV